MKRRSLLIALAPLAAAATPAELDAARRRFVGDRPLAEGRVSIEIAPLVENGHAVPVRLWVDGRARRLALLAEGNPLPEVIECDLGEACHRAELSTRIRLANSQRLVALAELADGSCWQRSVEVIVTLAACVEGEAP
jgi:sulfur-oxidizing protein SoxY